MADECRIDEIYDSKMTKNFKHSEMCSDYSEEKSRYKRKRSFVKIFNKYFSSTKESLRKVNCNCNVITFVTIFIMFLLFGMNVTAVQGNLKKKFSYKSRWKSFTLYLQLYRDS